MTTCIDPPTLAELRNMVIRTICEHSGLLLESVQLREKVLRRGGQPCGMHFIMHGPRSVKFSAIWDSAQHTILFYDCAGERFHRSELAPLPALWQQSVEGEPPPGSNIPRLL
jgi:hypothetical protein